MANFQYKIVKPGKVTLTDEVLDTIECPNCKSKGKELFTIVKNITPEVIVITFKIKEPIWSSKSIGLLKSRVDTYPDYFDIYIEITYQNKQGNRTYPDKYYLQAKDIKKYPIYTKNKNSFYIIPIKDLKIVTTIHTVERTMSTPKSIVIDGIFKLLEQYQMEIFKERDFAIKDKVTEYIQSMLPVKENDIVVLFEYVNQDTITQMPAEKIKIMVLPNYIEINHTVNLIKPKDNNFHEPKNTLPKTLETNYLGNLASDIHQYAVDKGFWTCPECNGDGVWDTNIPCPVCKGKGKWRNDGECIALMHSELTEALEQLRGGNTDLPFYLSNSVKPEGWAVELADCVIRILDFVASKGIENKFGDFIKKKMEYNKTREYKHGKKF